MSNPTDLPGRIFGLSVVVMVVASLICLALQAFMLTCVGVFDVLVSLWGGVSYVSNMISAGAFISSSMCHCMSQFSEHSVVGFVVDEAKHLIVRFVSFHD